MKPRPLIVSDAPGIRTASGQIVTADSGAPTLMDISQSLSRMDRWQGYLLHPWNVAVHSLVVGDLLPRADRLHGYLHDAAESCIGDIASPFKNLQMKVLEDAILRRIYKALGVPWPSRAVWGQVHEADVAVREAEFSLWHPQRDESACKETPARTQCLSYEKEIWYRGDDVRYVDPEKSQYLWLDAVERELQCLGRKARANKAFKSVSKKAKP